MPVHFSQRPPFLNILLSVGMQFLFLVPRATSQTTSSAQKPPHQISVADPVDQEQFISYWTTETGWRSELQLRNNLAGQDLTVTPVLRIADGTEAPLAPVSIKPQEVKSLDIEEAARGSAPQSVGTYGSLVLRYHSVHYANLYAVLMLRNQLGVTLPRRHATEV